MDITNSLILQNPELKFKFSKTIYSNIKTFKKENHNYIQVFEFLEKCRNYSSLNTVYKSDLNQTLIEDFLQRGYSQDEINFGNIDICLAMSKLSKYFDYFYILSISEDFYTPEKIAIHNQDLIINDDLCEIELLNNVFYNANIILYNPITKIKYLYTFQEILCETYENIIQENRDIYIFSDNYKYSNITPFNFEKWLYYLYHDKINQDNFFDENKNIKKEILDFININLEKKFIDLSSSLEFNYENCVLFKDYIEFLKTEFINIQKRYLKSIKNLYNEDLLDLEMTEFISKIENQLLILIQELFLNLCYINDMAARTIFLEISSLYETLTKEYGYFLFEEKDPHYVLIMSRIDGILNFIPEYISE